MKKAGARGGSGGRQTMEKQAGTRAAGCPASCPSPSQQPLSPPSLRLSTQVRTHLQVDVGAAGDLLKVHCQDLAPPLNIWVGHHHVPVKAAGAHQRLVQRLWEVCGGDDNDACRGGRWGAEGEGCEEAGALGGQEAGRQAAQKTAGPSSRLLAVSTCNVRSTPRQTSPRTHPPLTLRGLEAVQLHQQLVERHLHVLLILGVAAATCSTMQYKGAAAEQQGRPVNSRMNTHTLSSAMRRSHPACRPPCAR